MAKTVCKILGVVFLLVGLLGFVSPDFLGAHLTAAHNVVHLVSGAVALYFGFAGSLAGAKTFALVFGVVYLGLGVLGFGIGCRSRSRCGCWDRCILARLTTAFIFCSASCSWLAGCLPRRQISFHFQVARASFVSGANASSDSNPCNLKPRLKPHAHSAAANSARREKTILVIRLVKNVLNTTKKDHSHAFRLTSLITGE